MTQPAHDTATNAWIAYYDSPHAIYANARHRDVHFRRIAQDIARYVPSPQAAVLDYGCGEALSADIVAAAAGRLILAEPAPGLRARVAARFSGNPKIAVIDTQEVAALPPGSIELAVMHSVLQYMTAEERDAAFRAIRAVLKPDGAFVLGDVLAPDVGALTDAAALLRFGLAEGFFLAAAANLVRMAFSPYRRLRAAHGLAHYTEADIVGTLAACGFAATRQPRNIGHSQTRMTFLCRPVSATPVTHS